MSTRLKIKAKDLMGFDEVVQECHLNQIPIYVVSPKRFMVSTDELPIEVLHKFNNLGVTVVQDTQYSMDIMQTS
ncbi:MAG: hypothetical protein HQL93_09950 [Magnetococcales bacterium]|nr:hypothetical protein [Magnetococcales bacterium]